MTKQKPGCSNDSFAQAALCMHLSICACMQQSGQLAACRCSAFPEMVGKWSFSCLAAWHGTGTQHEYVNTWKGCSMLSFEQVVLQTSTAHLLVENVYVDTSVCCLWFRNVDSITNSSCCYSIQNYKFEKSNPMAQNPIMFVPACCKQTADHMLHQPGQERWVQGKEKSMAASAVVYSRTLI